MELVEQTPELNRYKTRSTSGPLCSASCLKLLFIDAQIEEKAFFSTCEVYTLVFFFFFPRVTKRVNSREEPCLALKCTNVQSY